LDWGQAERVSDGLCRFSSIGRSRVFGQGGYGAVTQVTEDGPLFMSLYKDGRRWELPGAVREVG
jgi:hypothetical protein